MDCEGIRTAPRAAYERAWRGNPHLELWPQFVVEREDGGDVAAAVAVVGRRPHRDEVLVRKMELVACCLRRDYARGTGEGESPGERMEGRRKGLQRTFHHELVGAAHKAEPVEVQELVRRPRPEQIPAQPHHHSPSPSA